MPHGVRQESEARIRILPPANMVCNREAQLYASITEAEHYFIDLLVALIILSDLSINLEKEL